MALHSDGLFLRDGMSGSYANRPLETFRAFIIIAFLLRSVVCTVKIDWRELLVRSWRDREIIVRALVGRLESHTSLVEATGLSLSGHCIADATICNRSSTVGVGCV